MPKEYKLPEDYNLKLNAMELGMVWALVAQWQIDNRTPGLPADQQSFAGLRKKLDKIVEKVYVKDNRTKKTS